MKMVTAEQASKKILSWVNNIPVIPVLVVDNAEQATDLAKVLVDSGLPLLEVTLRTPAALAVIEKMAAVDGAIVAAGTVLTDVDVNGAKDAGASFLVSPGSTKSLIKAASQADMPLLPGAVTASEIMSLAELGFRMLKFFPAQSSGGVKALKSFSGPMPHISFCPTGGISMNNLDDYLALSNVACVGGSWLVTDEDSKRRDWQSIAMKAKAVMAHKV